MVRRKSMKNILNEYLTEDLKAKPHFISKESWVSVKETMEEFKSCFMDEFLREEELITILNFMNFRMEALEMFEPVIIMDCKNLIWKIMENYLRIANKEELFESSYNIKFVLDLFAMKVNVR